MMLRDEALTASFFTDYFTYIGESESPPIYHRWASIAIIAALLGRQAWFPFGHTKLYPNFYIMLVGSPGTRKGTAITPAKKVLRSCGYSKFSPDRLSPERFIAELVNSGNKVIIDGEEFEQLAVEGPSELFIAAPEFGDFIGRGNFAFVDLLTNLWDNLDDYQHPKLHGKSIHVSQPTVNLLTATTPQGIALSIPPEAIGQGFMSRFILVYGEPTGHKITFPKAIEQETIEWMASKLKDIKTEVQGEFYVDREARELFHRIYREFEDLDDFRFKHYATRRFTHVIKLAAISAASRYSLEITNYDALFANTLLHYTEQNMARALGEFGKAKHAEVSNNILEIIRHTKTPLGIKELWKKVSQDLNTYADLQDIVRNLLHAGKLQQVAIKGKSILLPLREVKEGWKPELLAPELFLLEERI
jgi:hypothetical protein